MLALAFFQAKSGDPDAFALETNIAWTYVGIRVVHGMIYASVNPIMARFGIYIVSEITMFALFVRAVGYVF